MGFNAKVHFKVANNMAAQVRFKQLADASGIRHLGNVPTYEDLPTNPKHGDMYSVGEAWASNNPEYIWTFDHWEFVGAIPDLSEYLKKELAAEEYARKADVYTKTEANQQIAFMGAAKQDSLSEAQILAVNSGITVEKVEKYEGYSNALLTRPDKDEVNTLIKENSSKYKAGENIIINGDIISSQVPPNVFTRENLISGEGVEIVPEPPKGEFDSHTLACFHFENNFDNAIQNSPVSVSNAAGSFSTDYKKFGEYSLAGGPRIAVSRTINTNDFTADFWVLLTSNNAWHAITCGQINITPNDNGWNIAGAGVSTRYEPEKYLNTWTHIAVARKDMVYYVFFDGILIVVSEPSTTTSNTLFSWQASSFYYALDELRISDIARWTGNFTPHQAAYPYEPTGRHIVNALKNTAFKFIDVLPDTGEPNTFYVVPLTHQLAEGAWPCVALYVYDKQWYSVSDSRLKMLNSEVFVAEKTAEQNYWACMQEKNEAVSVLSELQNSETPDEAAISAQENIVSDLEARLENLAQERAQCKAAANAARQEAAQ